MLVTNLVNVRYLTGFTGSNGLALIGPNTRVFVTRLPLHRAGRGRGRPGVRARHRRPGSDRRCWPSCCPRARCELGFESEQHDRRRASSARASCSRSGSSWSPSRASSSSCALVKDEHEIELIAAATRIADEAFEALLAAASRAAPSASWRSRSSTTCACAARRAPSFDSIVAAGPHGALPHAQPRDVKIERRRSWS